MQTKSTGPLGGMFGSPLAAGNLFLGTFKLTVPAIKSTLFGIPYNFKTAPKAIKGYFKYKAGQNFVVNSKTGTNLTKDTGMPMLFCLKSRIKQLPEWGSLLKIREW